MFFCARLLFYIDSMVVTRSPRSVHVRNECALFSTGLQHVKQKFEKQHKLI